MALKDRLHKGRARLAGVNWYLCSGIGFLLLVLAAFGMAAWKLGLVLNDAEALPIEAVAIKGERQYTTDAEIRGALQDLMQRSFSALMWPRCSRRWRPCLGYTGPRFGANGRPS